MGSSVASKEKGRLVYRENMGLLLQVGQLSVYA